jgi:glycosyltransferase involved in cell wall biosynthesis
VAAVRVAIDVRSLMDRPTGIGRYVGQIVRHLLRDRAHEVVLFSFGGHTPSPALRSLLGEPNATLVHHPLPMRTMRGLWRVLGAPPLERVVGGIDAVIAAETTMPVTTAPVAAVVHDCLWHRHPEWFNAYTRRAGPENLADVAARAAVVLVVSNRSRDDVASLCPTLAPRLFVVSPAADAVTSSALSRRAVDTVLFTGTLEPRKGLGMLARALLRSRGAAARARLIVVGGRGWGSPEGREAWDLLERAGRCDHYGYADDATLTRLRATATIAAVPSLDEGFGLPLLEAMASGAPALASDTAIFREVGEDGCAYADAGDVDAWADALDALFADPNRRRRLTDAGHARARAFAPERQRAALAVALDGIGLRLGHG